MASALERYRSLSEKVESLAQVYYFALFGVVNLLDMPKKISTGLFPVYRWPLNLFNGIESGKVHLAAALTLIASCCLAGSKPRSQFFRVLVFVALFCFNASVNSTGGTTHLYEFWLWSSFVLATLPSSRIRFRFPIAWWGAQTIVLLFYGLSGCWKLIGAIVQLAHGEPTLFGTQGLPYHLASEILRTGSNPILGDWLLDHASLSPILALAVVLLQLSCLVAIFRAELRRWIGVALIGFHLGTYLFLAITYPTNVLLVGVLLAASPIESFNFPLKKRPSYPNWIWASIGCYLMIALGTALSAPGGELFPFFNGHWFIYVPHRVEDYGLYVTSIDGKPLKQAAYVESIYKRFKAWPFAIYGSIQEWGRANSERSQEAAQRRDFALRLIFGKHGYQAELRKRELDPLVFVRDRQVIHEQLVEAVSIAETEESPE